MKRITVVLLFFFLAVTALPAAQETAKEILRILGYL